MNRLTRIALHLALILPLAGPAAADGKRLYKWTDERGTVQYSDAPPAVENRAGIAVLNRDGLVTRPAESPEQQRDRAAREAELKRADEQRRARQRQDRALLSSYTSSDDILRQRDRNLGALNGQIDALNLRRFNAQSRLRQLLQQVDALEHARQPLPADLLRDIAAAKTEIETIDGQLVQKRQELVAVRQRADDDVQRFNELRR